jgi:septal ring factor EnvC (AmiA/AmiB activator)
LIKKSLSDFVEKLTHDSFIVQVNRITDRFQTKLDKLLSVFEQTNFVDDNEIIKEYNHEVDIDELKIVTDILHYSGTNPSEKKKIENEQEAWRTFDALTGNLKQQVEEQIIALNEKDKALSEKDKALSEKDKALNEKDNELLELKKQMEELKKGLSKQ